MKRHILLIPLLAVAAFMFAVPAKRGIYRTLKLADGRTVRAELTGDEHINFWQTETGERFVRHAQNDFYVAADMEELRRNALEKRAKAPLRSPRRVAIGDTGHPDFTGKKKGLIILAEFTDKKFEAGHDAEYYTHVANDVNFTSADGHVGSIHDYFMAQSDGQFDLTFDVVGPVQLANNMAYYGAHYGSSNDCNPGEMIYEAVLGAERQLGSFADYDWFGDGYVDQVFVIYAGRGEASGGSDDTIWPHRSEFYYGIEVGGKLVKVYACSNEMQTDTHVDGIGTFCHEFSHCLGLPDLYDTAYTGNYGMGMWDIMSSGSYLGNSFRPCAYSGYERNFCGWKQPVVLTEDTQVTGLKGISEGGDYYIIYNDAYKNEHYILENRTRSGWDASLPGSGLLITYIDFDRSLWQSNRVNTTDGYYNDHQRYTPFLANNNRTTASSSGDVYPFGNNNALTDYTTPAATLHHANVNGDMYMGKPITDITRNADNTISFKFADDTHSGNAGLEGVAFYETFNKSHGTGGNDGTWTVSSSTPSLITDNDGWEASSSVGGNRCAIFGTAMKSGTATTPEISISGPATLTSLAATYGNGGTSLTVSCEDGNISLSETKFTLEPGRWNDISATITAPSYPATFKITFAIDRRRFFLDEVKATLVTATGITSISDGKGNDGDIADKEQFYNLSGQRVDAAAKGLLIVRTHTADGRTMTRKVLRK